jgi:hypothetical protein
METGRTLKFDPHSGFGAQIGARVALLRCPVLRLSGNYDMDEEACGNSLL